MAPPPSSSGMAMPMNPISASIAIFSAGNVQSASSCLAIGSSSRTAKSRAVSRTMICSSVKSNLIAASSSRVLEGGFALLHERLHALFLIQGAEQRGERLLLELERRVQREIHA